MTDDDIAYEIFKAMWPKQPVEKGSKFPWIVRAFPTMRKLLLGVVPDSPVQTPRQSAKEWLENKPNENNL